MATTIYEREMRVATSVVVCDFVYVGDQQSVLAVDADRHCWLSNLVIARRCVAQHKVTGLCDSVGSDALFEVLLDPIQLV